MSKTGFTYISFKQHFHRDYKIFTNLIIILILYYIVSNSQLNYNVNLSLSLVIFTLYFVFATGILQNVYSVKQSKKCPSSHYILICHIESNFSLQCISATVAMHIKLPFIADVINYSTYLD